MGEHTGISWTDATWNPWYGCTKVSPGCDHCYMFREQRQYGRDPETVTRSKTKFTEPLKWKEPRLVFTCSWSDWFHIDADPWRDEAWDVIRRTPQHTYQILTKRPGRILRHLPVGWGHGWANVWLGTSIESQEYDRRIDVLLQVPALVHFLSCEPLLGPLDLSAWLDGSLAQCVEWVIAGGESGQSFRPMDLAWARSLRDQCLAAGVPFFMKQGSGPRPGVPTGDPELDRYKEFPTFTSR